MGLKYTGIRLGYQAIQDNRRPRVSQNVDGNQSRIYRNGRKEKINVGISEIEDDKWYSYIIYYLKNLTCPNNVFDHKRISLRLKAMKYCLTQDGLGWRNLDGVILKCVNKEEENKLVSKFHSGYCGDHIVACTITHKILRVGYY
jgi:hypothetical protein